MRRQIGSVLQQGVFDQSDHAAIPGIVCPHAQLGLLLEQHAAVVGVADLKADGIFGAAGSGDDTHEGLVSAELLRDIRLATTAASQRLGLYRLRVGLTDVDQHVAAGLCQQVTGFVGGAL